MFSLECHTVSTEQQQAITKHKTSNTQRLSKTNTKTQTNLLIVTGKQFGKTKFAPPIWEESAKWSN